MNIFSRRAYGQPCDYIVLEGAAQIGGLLKTHTVSVAVPVYYYPVTLLYVRYGGRVNHALIHSYKPGERTFFPADGDIAAFVQPAGIAVTVAERKCCDK